MIVFSIVLGASLLEFNDYLFPPDPSEKVSWALFSTYLLAASSLEAWDQTVRDYPYTLSRFGRLRAIADAANVAAYAALLFISTNVDETLAGYLGGMLFVFVLYIVSGLLRRWEYDEKGASRPQKIIGQAVIFLALWAIYVMWDQISDIPSTVTWFFLLAPVPVIMSLRWFRTWKEYGWRKPPLTQ